MYWGKEADQGISGAAKSHLNSCSHFINNRDRILYSRVWCEEVWVGNSVELAPSVLPKLEDFILFSPHYIWKHKEVLSGGIY